MFECKIWVLTKACCYGIISTTKGEIMKKKSNGLVVAIIFSYDVALELVKYLNGFGINAETVSILDKDLGYNVCVPKDQYDLACKKVKKYYAENSSESQSIRFIDNGDCHIAVDLTIDNSL